MLLEITLLINKMGPKWKFYILKKKISGGEKNKQEKKGQFYN